jgi:OHCU decarboxylase
LAVGRSEGVSVSIEELNRLALEDAGELFTACCGSSRWVEEMVARRPFENIEALLATADEVWRATGPADWEEAFAAHPRIGEPEGGKDGRAEGWSREEQRRAARTDEETQRAIAEGNAEYERRFGRIYIVCASGRSAEELLADLRARLDSNPERERARAAEEQRKITKIRLRRLMESNDWR